MFCCGCASQAFWKLRLIVQTVLCNMGWLVHGTVVLVLIGS